MKEQLLSLLVEFILGIVGIIGGYVLKKISDVVKEQRESFIARKGMDNYNHALTVAKGMYYVLEDEFSSVQKSGDIKKSEMDKRLLQLLPCLTQDELNAINKQVCISADSKVKQQSFQLEELKETQSKLRQQLTQLQQENLRLKQIIANTQNLRQQ
ncbi:hypothetical protein ACFHWD_11225 [Clostridium sp. MT-14]|uniref:hypothetical protein n=1 Tax=Clostridium sp. MT-14 TaxID=3348360 RepID=UPI0035F409DE